MPDIVFKIFKASILSCLCLLSLGGIASGLFLSVTKSPTHNAQIFIEQSLIHADKMEHTEAEIKAHLAISHTPYNLTVWAHLEQVQKQQATTMQTAQRYKSFAALESFPTEAVSNP